MEQLALFDIEDTGKPIELYLLSSDLSESTGYVSYSENLYGLYLELLDLVEGKDINFWHLKNRHDSETPPPFDWVQSVVNINGEICMAIHYKNKSVLIAKIIKCSQEAIKFLA